ncbi:carbohydrate-binding protein [Acinetobacter sp. ANC 4558]|uniref:carbohydrate-binding protein n=1 Tax=Acinetobacter sp. ANC 4558 TaxID=1977876 RepID=UPI000A358659|nr:carbohydrate-binding protein [Acinetobacter sp. ANC 4558]OTG80805.1 carbohydrate-binding protein [Acinetobacter sp. ANC 4558]
MKQYIMKNNFSAGELSPMLYTRTDIQQYSNGAKVLKNVIPLVEGGVRKRPGTIFIKEQTGSVRIIPFIVNSNNSYMLILKANGIDVFNPRTKSVVASLTTPYTERQIQDIQFVQYRFNLFLTHNEVPIQRLRCSEDFTNWQISEFIYTYAPTDSENARYPFRKGKPSGANLGAFISFTLDAVTEWVDTQTYFKGDVVVFSRILYQAVDDNVGKIPNTSIEWVVTNNDITSVFTPADIGNYIDVNGGLIKITKYNNANSVSGEIVKKLESDINAIERSWSIIPPAFNASNGYPKCCTFFKQRLVIANTKKAPNKIWFSAVGDNGNFLETTDDSDAFSIVSASGLSNSILFLESQRGVICLTSSGEFMVDSDGVLSPTTVNINEHSAYGSYPVTRPERVGNELLFVQRGGERLRALTYRYEVDGLVSPEISSLAVHIGEQHKGINQISYQQQPESLVWCVLGDGTMASITFNRDQEVIAWAQHSFGGSVLSVSSMPTQLGSDRTFILINRKGVVCLEEFSFDALVDCQITGTNIAIPRYLDDVVAYQRSGDSVYQVDVNEEGVKSLGQNIECIVELFPPELSEAPLSSFLHKAKVDRTAFFFNKTIAPEINGELIEVFTFSDNVLGPKPPYTGYHLHEGGSWTDLHQIPLLITHNKPLPFHLQAITMQMSINEK